MFFKAFLNIFGSKSVMFSFSSVVVISLLGIIHLVISFCTNNFNWLGAFGALLTIYSLLLGFTHSVYPDFEKNSKDPVLKSGSNWVKLPTIKGAFPVEVSKNMHKREMINTERQ